MTLSPDLKRMVSSAHRDPLETKRAEILANVAEAEREFAMNFRDECETIRDRLARLGLEKATKQELREILMSAIDRGL